jgi:hypothetical protein
MSKRKISIGNLQTNHIPLNFRILAAKSFLREALPPENYASGCNCVAAKTTEKLVCQSVYERKCAAVSFNTEKSIAFRN